MKKNLIHKILLRFCEIRPGEAYPSVILFFYFFSLMASISIIKPVKISLYLHWLTIERLPYAYLLTAFLIGFFVSLNSRFLQTLKRGKYISFTLVFFISHLFIFWVLFHLEWPWLSMIFWFWADLFIATSVTQFWILINDIYNPRQARRLVSFLVGGGLLGGIAGSLLATFLVNVLGTENLLLICPGMLILCLIAVHSVQKFIPEEKGEVYQIPTEKKKQKIGYMDSLHSITESRHLLLLSGIVIAGIVVATLIDFQFNSVVASVFEKMDSRTSFLAAFFTGLLIFSYLLHVFSTSHILKKFGIRTALLIAPLFLLIGSAAIFFVPALFLIYWAMFIKGADKSLAHSLNQSVRELLYIPVSPDIKYKAKIFIDMFVNKFAKGLGAILLLLAISIFHFSIAQISLIAIVFIFLWIALNLLITKEYVNIVKKSLKIKWQDADKFLAEKIDVDMTKMVFDVLQSRKRSSVLYAMHLFDLVKKERMSPELKKIISYKSGQIRASSMDSLLELDGETLLPEFEDTLEDEDIDTQIKEIMSLDVYQELMKKHMDQIIAKGESGEGEISKMESAKAIGMMDANSPLVQNLRQLLRDKSPEVVRYAVESAGKLKKKEFVPLIIQQLRNPSIHMEASKALREYGPKILGSLKDYLCDPEENIRLQKEIPDIMAQIGTQRAADLLVYELRKKAQDTEAEIIEALYKLRSKDSQIYFQEKEVLAKIMLLIKKCYLIITEIHELMSDEKKSSLIEDLERNLSRSLKHIFELLSLIYPQEDIIKAYQNVSSKEKKSVDYSLELLDNILKKEIKEFILPLIDDIPFEDKFRKCSRLLKALEKSWST